MPSMPAFPPIQDLPYSGAQSSKMTQLHWAEGSIGEPGPNRMGRLPPAHQQLARYGFQALHSPISAGRVRHQTEALCYAQVNFEQKVFFLRKLGNDTVVYLPYIILDNPSHPATSEVSPLNTRLIRTLIVRLNIAISTHPRSGHYHTVCLPERRVEELFATQ